MKARKLKSLRTDHLASEHELYLNEETPCGIFLSTNGNKYIVTDHNFLGDDHMFRVAISLVNTSIPPFTWLALDEHPSDTGNWLGPCRIRLLNALAEDCVMGFPGVITTGDQHASIQCRHLHGVEMVSLGHVGRQGFEFRDFDGWVLESTLGSECFFRTGPRGDANLVLKPKWKRNGAAGLNNSLKSLIKEGVLEKLLARPNDTSYSYKSTGVD